MRTFVGCITLALTGTPVINFLLTSLITSQLKRVPHSVPMTQIHFTDTLRSTNPYCREPNPQRPPLFGDGAVTLHSFLCARPFRRDTFIRAVSDQSV